MEAKIFASISILAIGSLGFFYYKNIQNTDIQNTDKDEQKENEENEEKEEKEEEPIKIKKPRIKRIYKNKTKRHYDVY
jgi:uncharacterized protein HemX